MRKGTNSKDAPEFIPCWPSTAGKKPIFKSNLLPRETLLEKMKFSSASVSTDDFF